MQKRVLGLTRADGAPRMCGCFCLAAVVALSSGSAGGCVLSHWQDASLNPPSSWRRLDPFCRVFFLRRLVGEGSYQDLYDAEERNKNKERIHGYPAFPFRDGTWRRKC